MIRQRLLVFAAAVLPAAAAAAVAAYRNIASGDKEITEGKNKDGRIEKLIEDVRTAARKQRRSK